MDGIPVAPVDQGAVLRSGQAAVPNFAEQLMQQALLRVQQQNADTQQQATTSLVNVRNREAQQQAAFQEAVAQLGPHPTAAQIAQLMYRFPEMSEALKRGYDALDSSEQRATFQALANVMTAARNGNFELATRLMRERVQADTAAGHPDPVDTAILQALESQDPAQRNYAVDTLERTVAAINPERYANVYGTFSRNVQFHNGVYSDGNTGQVIAQDDRIVIAGPNGSFRQLEPLPNIPIIGSDMAPPAAQPSQQDGPVAGAAPQNGEAPAFGGGPLTVEDRSGQYPAHPGARASLPMGNPLDSQMSGGAEIVRVRSVQEARSLPPGTLFMTPDHRVMRVPGGR